MPGEEGHKGGRVEDALALQPIGPAGLGGEETIAHSECAWLQIAEDRARGRFDLARPERELVARGRRQRQVHGDVKGLVLARSQPTLKIFGVGEGAGQRWI